MGCYSPNPLLNLSCFKKRPFFRTLPFYFILFLLLAAVDKYVKFILFVYHYRTNDLKGLIVLHF